MARFVLGQLVLHVLRHDPWMKAWYGRIKRRRGSKIARVAVTRRLAAIMEQLVKNNEPYVVGGPAQRTRQGLTAKRKDSRPQRVRSTIPPLFFTNSGGACRAGPCRRAPRAKPAVRWSLRERMERGARRTTGQALFRRQRERA
jgi:hypothetical protein